MKQFLKTVFVILATLAGAFIAVGAFLDRCAQATKLTPKEKEPAPQKRPCEEAICAVDQCMPF